MALVGLPQDGQKKIFFDDSVITPATASEFANCFSLGHLWEALLW